MEAGIVTYGAYVPRFRIKPQEIAAVWGQDGDAMSRGLGVTSKSVPGPDEDVITIAVEAARIALNRASLNPTDIGAIYVGSESHPYAVKPSATIVAEAIGATPHMTAADYEFACKAGTAAIQTCLGLVGSESIRYGVAIGADTSQGAPGDALEYTASAGGAAYIIGREDVIATIEKTCSYTTDTPDFWRREGEKYPSHGGRFTGEPAYFKHVLSCATNLMELMDSKPGDYNYAVFHQPNGKFPVSVAKKLGFSKEQIADGLLTPIIGNTYSGAVLIGLASILEKAKTDDRIMMVSYGSGAGSDAFDIKVTDAIEGLNRTGAESLSRIIENHKFISYATYAKYMGKIHLRGA